MGEFGMVSDLLNGQGLFSDPGGSLRSFDQSHSYLDIRDAPMSPALGGRMSRMSVGQLSQNTSGAAMAGAPRQYERSSVRQMGRPDTPSGLLDGNLDMLLQMRDRCEEQIAATLGSPPISQTRSMRDDIGTLLSGNTQHYYPTHAAGAADLLSPYRSPSYQQPYQTPVTRPKSSAGHFYPQTGSAGNDTQYGFRDYSSPGSAQSFNQDSNTNRLSGTPGLNATAWSQQGVDQPTDWTVLSHSLLQHGNQ